jgi:hypothetical protein
MKTVVFQSYRTEDVPNWIATCMDRARHWSAARGFDYRFMDDQFFDLLPPDYRKKADGHLPILSDLARLILARNLMLEGYEKTIWIDADVLIFDLESFDLAIEGGFCFCREIWVQPSPKGGIRVFRNVHNAVCLFVKGNSFLEFYIDACQQIIAGVDKNKAMVNQIVGPKLLSALHNMIGYPLIKNVGMLSPLVLQDIDKVGGAALDLLVHEIPAPMQAANLCSSLAGYVIDGIDLNHTMMERVVGQLVKTKGGNLNRF